MRRAQIRKERPVRLETFQRQVFPQIEEGERRHDGGEYDKNAGFLRAHPASPSGMHALPFRSNRNRRIFFVWSENNFSE